MLPRPWLAFHVIDRNGTPACHTSRVARHQRLAEHAESFERALNTSDGRYAYETGANVLPEAIL
jgi:hypothetical protein